MKVPKYSLLIFLLTLFYCLVTYFSLYDYGSEDYWGWASIVRELSNMPLNNPKLQFFSTVHPFGPVPYDYNPYAWTLAMITKITHLSPFTLLHVAGGLNFILFAIGLHLFLKEYFCDSELSFLMLPIMLFFWGKSWDFSGVYDIGALSLNLCNPYAFAFALSFFALTFFIKYLRTGKIRFWIFLVFLLPLIILINLLPGFFVWVTMGLLLLLEKKEYPKFIFSFFALAVLTAIIAASWPYYSFLRLLKDGFSIQKLFDPTYYFYSEHLVRLGPALLGIPLVFRNAIKKREPLVVFGSLIFFLGYMLAYFFKSPVGWRILFFITFFLHLSITLYLREKLSFLAQPFILLKKNGSAVLFASVAFVCLVYQTISMTAKQLGFHSFTQAFQFVQNNKGRGRGLEKQFRFLFEHVPSDAIILSDIDTSRIVPAFSGKPVYYMEGNTLYDPLIQGLKERREEIQDFFNKEIPLDQRSKTINKYKAKYVLWNADQVLKSFPADLEKLGAVIYQKDPLTLIEIPTNSSKKKNTL